MGKEPSTQPLLSLHEAAEKGDIAGILGSLRAGEDVNSKANREYFGETPLIVAVQERRTAPVALLIAYGADVNVEAGRYDQKPLHWAGKVGDSEIAAILIVSGAEVNAPDRNGATALHYAARYDNLGMVKMLLDNGADVNLRMVRGQTPLGEAVRGGDRAIVERLICNGADLTAENQLGDGQWLTPLRYAVLYGSPSVAEALLANSVELDFFSAVGLGRVHLVKAMLKENPSLANATLPDKSTPLHWAARSGRKSIIQLLLKHGGDVNAKGKRGRTPLGETEDADLAAYLVAHGASRPARQPGPGDFLESVKEAKRLIREGRDLDEKDEYGLAALHYCSPAETSTPEARQCRAVMRILIEAGATLDITDNEGETPLHVAADQGAVEAAKVLLEGGANVDAQDHLGRTPMHKAVLANRRPLVELLLEHDADLSVEDNNGVSPLDVPVDRYNREIIRMLRAGGKA